MSFQCIKCKKNYSSLSSLNYHLNTNSKCGSKDIEYKCSYCNKIFYRKYNFIKHQEICKNKNNLHELKEQINKLQEEIKSLKYITNNTNNTNCHNTYYIQNNITSEDIINAAKKLKPDHVSKPKDILNHFWNKLNLKDKIRVNEDGNVSYYYNGNLITENKDLKFMISQIIYHSRDDMVVNLKDSIFEDLDGIKGVSDDQNIFPDIKTKEDLTIENITLMQNNISDSRGQGYKNTLIRCISIENKDYKVLEEELIKFKSEYVGNL